MTDHNTPASTLREAAGKLRELADERVVRLYHEDIDRAARYGAMMDGTFTWCDVMDPSVAEPLAAWLEAEARAWPGAPLGALPAALAVAHAVLGATPCS